MIAINLERKKFIIKKTEDLISNIEVRTLEVLKDEEKKDVYVDKILDAKKIIGDIKSYTSNESGDQLDYYIIENNQKIGIFDENYKKYLKISEIIFETKEINSLISIKTIKEKLFDWLIKRYKKNINVDFIDYLDEECINKIKEIEIYIPVHRLLLEFDIEIGKVKFINVSTKKINEWENNILKSKERNESNKNDIKNMILDLRKKIQGYSISSMKIFAEKNRAIESALIETEKSLSFLRFFSHSNLYPQLISTCTLLGQENIESYIYLVIEDGMLVKQGFKKIGNIQEEWRINKDFWNNIWDMGMKELHFLLLSDNINKFQKKLMNAIFIYTKNSLVKNIHDKLIYILMSIESILLKNQNEDISQNIGERIAFTISNNASERKSIIENVKDIYGLRSKYIHHGLRFDDKEKLETFMNNVFLFYIQLIKNIYFFKDKDHLLDFLEGKKLS